MTALETIESLKKRVASLEKTARQLSRRVKTLGTHERTVEVDYEITADMEAEWNRRLAALKADPTRGISLEQLKKREQLAKAKK